MLLDLARDKPEALQANVAIIGAGAAGITLARALTGRGLQVVLLESGGRDYEPHTAALNKSENVGLDYYPLDHARLRFFGGTTAIWGGRCAELDPIDFEKRAWVPHSGWPFGYAEIAPWYKQAWRVFGLSSERPAIEDLRRAGVPIPAFADDELAVSLWGFDATFDRFSLERNDDLVKCINCTIVLHATVREVVAAAQGGTISHLDVRNPDGGKLVVRASDYVLAAGGIENPRILLASNSVIPAGLGNANDQVGRYFMEHPHARGGRIVEADSWRLFETFAKRRVDGQMLAPLLAPSPALQTRERLLNTSLTIAPRRSASGTEALLMRAYLHQKEKRDPTRRGRALWKVTKQSVGWLQRQVDPFRPWLLEMLGRIEVALVVRAEQAPSPESRVLLSDKRDAMGMPRVKLDWRTSALDVESVRGLVEALGRETERLGLGRVEPAEWLSNSSREWKTDNLISAHPIGGYHHMGTTRMAEDPKQGVTDGWGRVHGIDNLHVAGSSLFPTSGWANPTLTIVALALRTAERLAQRAGR